MLQQLRDPLRARNRVLKIPGDWAWATDLATAWNRLHALHPHGPTDQSSHDPRKEPRSTAGPEPAAHPTRGQDPHTRKHLHQVRGLSPARRAAPGNPRE